MKITKSELKEIIKEEALRFISIQKLKEEKENIDYQLKKITENEELEEDILGSMKKGFANLVTPKATKEKGKQAFEERLGKLRGELESKGYKDDMVITVSKDGKRIDGLDEDALKSAAEQNAYKGRLVYKYSPRFKKVVVNFSPGKLTHASIGDTGMAESFQGNLSESQIREIAKEEALKAEKIKKLQEQSEKLIEKLKNL